MPLRPVTRTALHGFVCWLDVEGWIREEFVCKTRWFERGQGSGQSRVGSSHFPSSLGLSLSFIFST